MSITQPIILQPSPNVRKIKYLSKNFADFKENFKEYAKAYFPNTYSDFNEASPGMMFIEMASYLGDVLSFYIDNQFKENLMAYAEQRENVFTIAQFLGYKPKLISPSTTILKLTIIVPAKQLSATSFIPDPRFLLKIAKGSTFKTEGSNPIMFRLTEDVDFSYTTSQNWSVTERNNITNTVTKYAVTTYAPVVSGEQKAATFSFGSAQKFASITLEDDDVVGIENVVDSDGNIWYEVQYLSQDVILDDLEVSDNSESGIMPSKGIRFRKVPRRFVTKITPRFKTQLVFGSGIANESELDLIVDSRQIANSQYGNTITNSIPNLAINNLNFLNSSAFGVAPFNTTLTVTYLVGGGVETNTPSRTITVTDNIVITNDTTGYTVSEQTVFGITQQSLVVTNEEPATGGGPGDTVEEIKENAMMFFNAQNRVITHEDYVVRSYSLPSKFGSVAKAYALRDEQLNIIQQLQEQQFVTNNVSPTKVNLYTLGYDRNKKLTKLNTQVKENLKRYLSQYRMLTDDVEILDAFVINIGVRFSITTFKNYNMRDVVTRCIGVIQNYFDISKWTINQPIILSELQYAIGSVSGVQNITNLEIVNKYLYRDGRDYQPYRYNIAEATTNGVIYPSLDPSIFELRYPQYDIELGEATQ